MVLRSRMGHKAIWEKGEVTDSLQPAPQYTEGLATLVVTKSLKAVTMDQGQCEYELNSYCSEQEEPCKGEGCDTGVGRAGRKVAISVARLQ